MIEAPGRSGRARYPAHRLVLAGLALTSAAAAVVLSQTVFGHLSINNDEGIYRLQAEALAHGHLFGPAPFPADSFRPWLAAVVDDHYVLKYTPVFPAVLALSAVVSGGPLLALGAIAAAAVVTTHLLALEMLGDRREAMVAAALFAASPLVVVQSGLLLPYLLTVLLLELFAWGLLRGLADVPSGGWVNGTPALVTAGTALGLALVARPFDAVLFGVPIAVGAMGRRWRQHLTRRRVVAVGVPMALALAGFLAFNTAATGSPLRPTFSLLESRDTFGFGDRFLFPTDIPHPFGPREGLEGIVRNGSLLVGWVAGGVILVALALSALVRRRAPAPALWLTASSAVLVAGYGFFWGPWNAATQWGGTRFVGAFYFLPVVVPLTLLAARSLTDLVRRQLLVGMAVVAVMAGVSAATLTTVLVDNSAFESNNRMMHELVTDNVRHGLVFTTLPDPFLMHPTPVVANRWDLSGPVVYAIAGQGDLEAMSAMPDRRPWHLSFDGSFIFPDQPFSARLQPLKVVSGSEVTLHLSVRAPGAAEAALTLTASGKTSVYPIASNEGLIEDSLVIGGPDGAHLQARQPASTWPEPTSDDRTVTLRLTKGPGPGAPTLANTAIPIRTTGDSVAVLAPAGPPLTTGPSPPPRIEVTPAP